MKIRRNFIQLCLLGAALLPALISGAQTVTKIAAGGEHSLFIKSDGSLWDTGFNAYGQLGDDTTNNVNRPEEIVTNGVIAIAAGEDHSLFLKSDGSLWGMGDNYFGELGDGHFDYVFGVTRPEQTVASNVTAIAAGYGESLFLKNDGSLWAMGDNSNGQLGDGNGIGANVPDPIVTNDVTAIAAGFLYSLFLKSNGSLWAMGYNAQGELGDGTTDNGNYETNIPEQIVGANVTAIAAGYEHSLFLKSDGSLWGMGDNSSGALGDGTTNDIDVPEEIETNNVTAIAAGEDHSLFLRSDGSLWGMGGNDFGQLGDGTYNAAILRPEMIVSNNVTAISAGDYHSLFLKSDGSLWAMGADFFGQLGDGTDGFYPSPYAITNRPEQILAGSIGPPGNYQISAQLLSGGNMRLSFVGIAGANYALDRTFKLSPANWVPQVTNTAGAGGALVFTNIPNMATNNFWRIRFVP